MTADSHRTTARGLLRRAIGLTIAVALAAGAAVTGAVIAAPQAAVATTSGNSWIPGYIVSDANFYDGTALNAPGVQSFLQSHNAGCAGRCILNYTQNTPNMAADPDKYCTAMTGIAGESAASIIARVGAACNLSQRSLLVLIEKEEGLVSSRTPSQFNLDHATGFNCPDTNPCDPAYAGFFYQIYYAARQFQVYRAKPTHFNYQPHANNNILFSPNAACGRATVYIANDATAGLYDYTPYQPNAAALANMYGTGDGCSAYGNRNFWRLWSDWFGSPTGPPITLATLAGTQTTYLIGGGRRYIFQDPALLAQYSGYGTPTVLTQAQLDIYADGGPAQRAVQAIDGSVWLLDGPWRFRFVTCTQIYDFGLPCSGLPQLSMGQIGGLVLAGDLHSLAIIPGGSIWLMQAGVRHQVTNPNILAPYGIGPQLSGISTSTIGNLPIGAPLVGTGLYSDGTNGYKTIGGNGLTYDVPNAAVGPGLAAKASRLQPQSFSQLPASTGSMPLLAADGSVDLILSDNGWLVVSPSLYGGAAKFTTVPASATAGIPAVALLNGPHFIAEHSGSQVYLVSGGYLSPLTSAQVTWATAAYGLNPTVWRAADGSLAAFDQMFTQPYTVVRQTSTGAEFLISGAQRSPIPPELVTLYASLGPVQNMTDAQLNTYNLRPPAGRVVKTSSTQAYLIDSGKRFAFANCAQVADYGTTCNQVPLVSIDQLSALSDGGSLKSLLRLANGSTWLVQSGQRRETPVPSVLAPFGIPSATTLVSDDVVANLTVGPPVLGGGVVTDGSGAYRAVSSAGNFDVPAAALAGTRGTNAPRLQPASFAQLPSSGPLPLRATSSGRYFIMTDAGWLEVSGAAYTATKFTQLPSNAWNGVPIVRTQLSPHFIRERSSTQVYLVSGGSLSKVANTAAQNFIASAYGVENRVWVAADGALQGLTGVG